MNSARARRSHIAFTLVEVLVVIVIIAVLAALLFPLFGTVMAQTRSTKCTSNLKQIGKGILSYCTEHEDYLPGPLAREQYPNPQLNPKGSLAAKLAPYLGAEDKTAKEGSAVNRTNLFLCPAYEQHFRQAEGVVYAMNMRKMTQYAQPVWGDEGQGQEPLKKNNLSNWVERAKDGGADRALELSRTFALKDTDQEDILEEGEEAGGGGLLAPKPAHGDHRNALFFDFHVGKLDLKTNEPK